MFKYSLSIFLALLMLASATGITLNKMICLSSGKTIMSISELKDCCEDIGSSTSSEKFKANCCEFSKTYLALDYEALVKTESVQLLPPVLFYQIVLVILPSFESFSQTSFSFDLPPPRSGFDMLKLIRVFLL